MTVLTLSAFHGEVPKLPAHALQPGYAQEAVNCDLSHAELRPLKGLSAVLAMANSVQSLYTQDGSNYFTWPYDVDAVKSPTIDDVYNRVYYTTPTDFRVTQAQFMRSNGGEPSTSWRVGVPQPLSAPSLILADKPSLPQNVTLKCRFWFEDPAGVKYQEADLTNTLTAVSVGRKYQVTAPAREATPLSTSQTTEVSTPTYDTNGVLISTLVDTIATTAVQSLGTPDGAKRCFLITGHNQSGIEVFRLYSSRSSISHGNATTFIPGGASLSHTGLAVNADGTLLLELNIAYGIRETRVYTFTLVNQFSEEGPPSLPVVVEFDWMNTIALQLNTSYDGNYVPIKKARIYRTRTGMDGSTDYYFTAEISVAGSSTTYNEAVPHGAILGEMLHTKYFNPPNPALVGLMVHPNGFLAAWTENRLRFSEPYLPYAWKPEYTISLPYPIVGAVIHGQSIIVTTKGGAWMVNGALPEAMMAQKLPAPQSGSGKRSIVNLGGIVVYASNDGLVSVDGSDSGLSSSQALFTREDWRTRYGSHLANMILVAHDGFLVGMFPNMDGFILRLDEAAGALVKTTLRGSAAMMLPQTDGLYIASGNTISQFAAGSVLNCSWQSKDVILPKPVNFGACQIVAEGTMTVKIYADGALKQTKTVTGQETFRLPGGFLARRWSVRLEGTGVVKEVYLATSPGELQTA